MPVRLSAYNIESDQQQTFMRAVEGLVANGTYARLAQIHEQIMMHRMHAFTDTGGSNTGLLRFLPWHRAYLLEFERALVGVESAAFIPYWDWTVANGVPDWIRDFTPDVTIGSGSSAQTLEASRANTITNFLDPSGLTTLLAIDDFNEFTTALEGGPHNIGHSSIGGVMNSMLSPVDPMFWLHHAMVDRVWARWQVNNPGELPALTGSDATMDPWSYTVEGLESIADLGYSYDDVPSSMPARRRGGGGGGGAQRAM